MDTVFLEPDFLDEEIISAFNINRWFSCNLARHKITMVTGTNAGGQTKRDNEQSLETWKPPTPKKPTTIMHGSILLVTMPPPPPRHTPRSLQFVSFLEVYPPATNSCTSFLSIQKQNDTFSQLLWTFSRVSWEKDNGCQNVVKTWTINLKMKRKKINSEEKAPSW